MWLFSLILEQENKGWVGMRTGLKREIEFIIGDDKYRLFWL